MAASEPPSDASRLEVTETARRHQREWFAHTRARVLDGEPLAIANADTPLELLAALDIPYVVNQWWASLCAAKQKAPRYLARVRERGYPADTDAYSAIALGSRLDDDEDPPWGGLPTPSYLVVQVSDPAQRKLFEAWGAETGAEVLAFEKTAADRVEPVWWDRIAHDWEDLIGTERLDLMVAELAGVARLLETATGRTLDEARLQRILDLVNQQERHNARARDAIAGARPAPVDVVDTIPAVMLPQWHRGSAWGRDAAAAFAAQVEALAADGAAACPDERIRLMWIGTGPWARMGFLRDFQATHGAVFVWSFYLGIAADGYPREGRDPLRTLAARWSAFTDLLYMPPWSSGWYAKEARGHGVDGAVHLVPPGASRGEYFITRALEEEAGVPVLELHADSADGPSWDTPATRRAVERFIVERAGPVADARRRRETGA